jgi:lipopolysaccharide export system permease protein
VLFIGNMLRIIEMMSKGISIAIILKFLLLLLPFMLAYSIPMSILTSVLLVFSRLSADNEITAIRASGINLKNIFKPVLICTILIIPLCYYINDNLRPNSIFAGRKLLLELGFQEPTVNLATGRFNEIFPNYVIYVGQKQGKGYKQVVVYKFEDDKVNTVINAENGQFLLDESKDNESGSIAFQLNKGVIEELPKEEQETAKLNRIQFDTYNIEFNIKQEAKDMLQLSKKDRERTNRELIQRIGNLNNDIYKPEYKLMVKNLIREISCIRTRIHNRIAMSFACLVFVLVGIPLGIKVHRSETSVGAGVSLMLVGSYYFLMTLGEAFQDNASLHPWLLMWVPNIIMFFIGTVLIYRVLKK